MMNQYKIWLKQYKNMDSKISHSKKKGKPETTLFVSKS